MMTITLWIVSILLSVFMFEDIYEDCRALDRDHERTYNEPPATFRAMIVAAVCVGGLWGFSLALAALAGAVT